MAKRKAITKGVRFDVFKRDAFKCQYCGRSAPDVILEVDHIVPVAEGGDNDPLNLITSCRDCNRGKGKKKLSENTAVDRQRQQLEDLNAIREQTEMLVQWKRELLLMDEAKVTAIDELFKAMTGNQFTETGRREIMKYLKRFPFEDVYAAAEIAFQKYYPATAVNKIGGICYNWARKREAERCRTDY